MYRVSADVWDTWVDFEPNYNVARDFATSGFLSGGTGLGGGHSWPDLDSLPFGWLAEPGTDNVAYRSSRLTDIEQKSMITLWAMAKSPLMFGGDMKRLDQATLDILTNPAVLELNSNSMGNAEVIRFATAVRVTDCASVNDTKWKLATDSSQICWKGSKCLNWRSWLNQSNGEFIGQARTDNLRACLDADLDATLDDQLHFSNCGSHPSQAWRLNSSGHLVSEHLNTRCAVVVEQDDLTHIWVGYGPSGEVYLAFFNASPRKTQMSIHLEDLLDEFYTTIAAAAASNNTSGPIFTPNNRTRWRCYGEEVWSGKRILETDSVSFKVDGHGCALFLLSCNFNLRAKDVTMLSRVLLASFLGIVAILTTGNVVRWCWTSRKTPKKSRGLNRA